MQSSSSISALQPAGNSVDGCAQLQKAADASVNPNNPSPAAEHISSDEAPPVGPVASTNANPADATGVPGNQPPPGGEAVDNPSTAAQATNIVARDPLSYPALVGGFEHPLDPASNANDLDVAGWRQVFQINQLLHGFQIRQENQDVVRARQNAFDLSIQPGNTWDTQLPCFQVEDGTLVEVYETRNDLQRSLARNAFSKRSIETNLSAGDFGVDVGPVFRREGAKTKMNEVWTESKDQEYYAAYIYPRARIFLDEDELRVSEACARELRQLRLQPSFQALQKFYKRFGHVFVTSVLLGGQQKTTKFAGGLDRQDTAKQQDAIRWAVGAKVTAPYATIGAQYSREKGSDETSAEKDYVNSSYLALSATGGNTLIGSDIPKWAPTIAPSKNWRVVKNEIALPIQEVIGAVPGWNHVPQMFREIHESRPSAERPWKGKLSLWIGTEPLYWDRRERRLVLKSASTDGSAKAVLKVVDRDRWRIGVETPSAKLLADEPVWIRSQFLDSNGDALHVERGSMRQWPIRPGGDVSNSPFVFSFRPAGTTGPWAPKRTPPHEFRSGDNVNLYCHSLGLGLYPNIEKPPTHASPAVFGRTVTRVYEPAGLSSSHASVEASAPLGGTLSGIGVAVPSIADVSGGISANYESNGPNSVHFPVPPEALPAEVKRLIIDYDTGRMSPADQAAFEKMGFISTREFAPGPNVENEEKSRTVSFAAELGVNVGGVNVGPSMSWSRTTETTWTRVDGKKYRVDYKKLQTVSALKNAPLEWDRCRTELLESAGYPHICNESPTAFRVMFE